MGSRALAMPEGKEMMKVENERLGQVFDQAWSETIEDGKEGK